MFSCVFFWLPWLAEDLLEHQAGCTQQLSHIYDTSTDIYPLFQ